MTIADAARATRKYFVARRPMPGGMGGFSVYDRTAKPAGVFRTEDEAQAACDRLNLLAVLEAIREPSEAQMIAGTPASEHGVEPDVYTAMIDELIAEVSEASNDHS